MGEGNWLPPDFEVTWLATVQPEAIYGEDEDACPSRYQDALRKIIELLPKSFHACEDQRRWVDGALAIAENALAEVLIYEDSYNRLHVALHPKHLEDTARAGLSAHFVKQIGDKFLRRLHEVLGPIYLRDGPWTSKKYEPAA